MKKNPLAIILGVIVVALLALVYAYAHGVIQPADVPTDVPKGDEVSTKTSPELVITSPTPGQSICAKDGAFLITWTATSSLDSLDISLESLSTRDTFYPIQVQFPAKTGQYRWNVADAIEKWTLEPSSQDQRYKLMLEGTKERSIISEKDITIDLGCY
jgi:hypothetical protein